MQSKLLRICVAAFLLLVIEVIVFSFAKTNVESLAYSGQIRFDPPFLYSGPIAMGRTVIQDFQVQDNHFSGIDIFFATYGKKNPSHLQLQLFDEGTLIAHTVIDASILQNNAYYRFAVPMQSESKDKMYRLHLSSPDATAETGVTVRYAANTVTPANVLRIDGVLTDGMMFIVPQHQVSSIDRLGDLQDRIYANKGGVVPRATASVLIFAFFWLVNIALIGLLQELWILASKNDQ